MPPSPTSSVSNVRATSRTMAAWAKSSPAVRVAAALGGIVAIASTVSDRVPVAAGLAAAVLVAAALVDASERRLPNRTIAFAAAVFAVVGVVERLELGSVGLAAGIACFALPIAALHTISPTAMGFGDVKLAGVLGAVLGAVDWRLSLWALALSGAASAIIALVRNQPHFAFGPSLVAATIGLLALTASLGAFQITGS